MSCGVSVCVAEEGMEGAMGKFVSNGWKERLTGGSETFEKVPPSVGTPQIIERQPGSGAAATKRVPRAGVLLERRINTPMQVVVNVGKWRQISS